MIVIHKYEKQRDGQKTYCVSRRFKHNVRIGIVVRYGLSEYTADDDDGFSGCVWRTRGNVRDFAHLAAHDFDACYDRSRRSTGWKNHKYRRQWEYKALR